MLGTAIVLQAAELLGWGGLWLKLKSDAKQQILVHGKLQPQKIPFVDAQLKKAAGHPTKFQRAISQRAVKLVRRIVNTRAFEHIATGLLNPKSSLRKRFKNPAVVEVL